jgi:hypothetical protein
MKVYIQEHDKKYHKEVVFADACGVMIYSKEFYERRNEKERQYYTAYNLTPLKPKGKRRAV